jgi:NAD(P)-dependent dehydrogenase (short-subunit alcohol dehydrogenase family)
MTNGQGVLLKGKVAIVSGGATGIGEAISKVFARYGANVVVNGLPGDPVTDVVAEIAETSGAAAGFIADAATVDGANGCVRAALDAFGRLDVVVANAAVFPEMVEVQDFPLERFEEVMHSNVRHVFLLARAAIPELRKTKGVLLAMGSEEGLRGWPRAVAYGASKGWVHAFIRGVAVEQGRYGIRANVVAPGPIDTEMTRPTKGNITIKDTLIAIESVPLGRRGTPEEVANVCLFLASDLASFVNGGVYTVDGGATSAVGLPGLEATREAKEAPPMTVPLRHQHEGRGVLA